MRLDLGCGQHKRDGYLGVDRAQMPSVDLVHNLCAFPWPFDRETVEAVWCAHFFEHVPGRLRGHFMNELWRIMKLDATAVFITPHWTHEGAIADYTHEWPPIGQSSYSYFDRPYRNRHGLTHYDVMCDFDGSFEYIPSHPERQGPHALQVTLIKRNR